MEQWERIFARWLGLLGRLLKNAPPKPENAAVIVGLKGRMFAMLGMNESPDAADVQQNKVMGILAYISILFLVPLLAAPNSRFAKYHANQGLTLFLVSLALSVVGFVVPFIGPIVSMVGHIGILVLAIMGIITASNGQMKPLPLIGQFTLLK